MTAGTRTLQPADGEGLDVDRVVAALGRRFTVEPGRSGIGRIDR